MSEDQFTKLFKYMQQRFDAVDRRFEQVDARFERMERILDAYAKEILDCRQEGTMLSNRVDRHQTYIEVLADKVGVNLHEIKA